MVFPASHWNLCSLFEAHVKFFCLLWGFFPGQLSPSEPPEHSVPNIIAELESLFSFWSACVFYFNYTCLKIRNFSRYVFISPPHYNHCNSPPAIPNKYQLWFSYVCSLMTKGNNCCNVFTVVLFIWDNTYGWLACQIIKESYSMCMCAQLNSTSQKARIKEG